MIEYLIKICQISYEYHLPIILILYVLTHLELRKVQKRIKQLEKNK